VGTGGRRHRREAGVTSAMSAHSEANMTEAVRSGQPALSAAARGDSFTPRPWAEVLGLWTFAVLPPILCRGLVQVLLILVLTIPLIFTAPIVAIVRVIYYSFRRRWRAAASTVLAAGAFVLATLCSLAFSDELRWHLLRPYLVAALEDAPIRSDGIRRIWWNGGMGWDVELEYHEADPDPRDLQMRGEPSCTKTLKKLAPHYFLHGTYC
jgi:hypothetical protein